MEPGSNLCFQTKGGFRVSMELGNKETTPEEMRQLKELITEYRDIFAADASEVSTAKGYQYEIQLQEDKVINHKPNRMNPQKRAIAQREVDKLIEAKIIEPSGSQYNNRVVIVPKPGGDYRFCCDLRDLNKITKPIAFNLPRISDVLDNLGGMGIFSKMDMQSGYHSVSLDPVCRHLTAFQVEGRPKYQYASCPMGLKGSSPAYLKLMNGVLQDLLYQTCNSFVDDVLSYAADMTQHLPHLREIFKRFRKFNMKINAKKCEFGKTKVKFLGYYISKEGVEVDPAKVEIIKNAPTPKNARDVLVFAG